MKAVAVLFCVLIGQCLAATTVEILAADPDMSTLVSLVTQAGLVDALNSGTFTIFAPNNAAFNALPSDTLSILGSNTAVLAGILKYHVVQGAIRSTDAKNELKLTTLNGQDVRFNIYTHNNVVTVQGSKIIQFDKVGSNGVIHVLEKVMLPPQGDIVDIVSLTSEVSTLLSLVQQAGIADALKADGLTVFAPTNDAFNRLSSSVRNRIISDKSLLTEILEYHVVPHTEYSEGLYNREYVRTLDRHQDFISLHIDSHGVRVNRDGHVTKADIGTTNGVVHLIDHVLIPARYYLTFVFGRK